MQKLVDVVALGELLIDYTQSDVNESGIRIFTENPGGAPGNMAVAVSKLGAKSAFIGKVGKDLQGDLLIHVLENEQVDTTGIIQDSDCFTTLAFVQLSSSGERKFSFARKPGADTQLQIKELPQSLLQQAKVFHFGSLSLTEEPSRSATLKAVEIAKGEGAIISYDPNYRELLWESQEAAIAQMRSVIHHVDVMKISDEETELLTGKADPKLAAEHLIVQGVKVVVVTLGAEGAYVQVGQEGKHVEGYKSRVVDTTGAGDSFWGGFIYCLITGGKELWEISLEDGGQYARFGNAVASLCVEKQGGIPAMPTLEEVRERMK